MVFQHFNLFPRMTARQNVALGPNKVLGLPRREASDKADEFLLMLGLADKATQHPAQLSGGQKQRVAIARALAMEPKVMLFDICRADLLRYLNQRWHCRLPLIESPALWRIT
jgi:ABC-type polar amino acid transport system ATPase subunit